MKRFLMFGILAAVCIAASPVQAGRGKMYASGTLAYGVLANGLDIQSEIDIDSGWGLMAALGYDTNKFRIEGEISRRSYDIDKIKVDGVGEIPVEGDLFALSYMVNGYYDHKIRWRSYRPYVGIGFGVTNVDLDLRGLFSQGSTELAYQAMFGMSFRYSRKMFLRAGYRFFGYTDNDGYVVHELNLGARYMF